MVDLLGDKWADSKVQCKAAEKVRTKEGGRAVNLVVKMGPMKADLRVLMMVVSLDELKDKWRDVLMVALLVSMLDSGWVAL